MKFSIFSWRLSSSKLSLLNRLNNGNTSQFVSTTRLELSRGISKAEKTPFCSWLLKCPSSVGSGPEFRIAKSDYSKKNIERVIQDYLFIFYLLQELSNLFGLDLKTNFPQHHLVPLWQHLRKLLYYHTETFPKGHLFLYLQI